MFAKFKEECFKHNTRFEKPIKRQKIKNFANVTVKFKITSGERKVKELQ